MTLGDFLGDWTKVIDDKILSKVLTNLEKEYQTNNIVPAQNKVFKAFHLCPLKSLKVVFLGMDPYPQKGVSTGILFANSRDTDDNALSPSLQVIKEAIIDYTIPRVGVEFDNTLESWCKQGILMINSALTTRLYSTGSHALLWRPFIKSLFENLSQHTTGIIYVLFGSQAQTFTPYIDRFLNDIIIEKHPAYYARCQEKMPNTAFLKVNDLLMKRYNESIDWFTELKI